MDYPGRFNITIYSVLYCVCWKHIIIFIWNVVHLKWALMSVENVCRNVRMATSRRRRRDAILFTDPQIIIILYACNANKIQNTKYRKQEHNESPCNILSKYKLLPIFNFRLKRYWHVIYNCIIEYFLDINQETKMESTTVYIIVSYLYRFWEKRYFIHLSRYSFMVKFYQLSNLSPLNILKRVFPPFICSIQI